MSGSSDAAINAQNSLYDEETRDEDIHRETPWYAEDRGERGQGGPDQDETVYGPDYEGDEND